MTRSRRPASRATSSRHHQAEQRQPPSPTTPVARSPSRSTSSGSTTSTSSSSTGRCPRGTTATTSATWRTMIELREDGRCDARRRLELRARSPRPDHRRDRRRPGGQPDRGPPLLRQRGGPSGRRRVTASRPRPGRRSPGAGSPMTRRSRRSPSGVDRTPAQVDPALAPPARRHRLPEVDARASGCEENFALFDFELADDDVAAIAPSTAGSHGRTGPNPNTLLDMIRSGSEGRAARPGAPWPRATQAPSAEQAGELGPLGRRARRPAGARWRRAPPSTGRPASRPSSVSRIRRERPSVSLTVRVTNPAPFQTVDPLGHRGRRHHGRVAELAGVSSYGVPCDAA